MKRLLVILALLACTLTPASAVFNGNEEFTYKNVSTTQGPFTLRGGQYGVTVSATFGGGSVTLQKLAADGTSYVTCLTAFSAAGYATANLPGGTYQFAVATATAVYIDITSVVTVQ